MESSSQKYSLLSGEDKEDAFPEYQMQVKHIGSVSWSTRRKALCLVLPILVSVTLASPTQRVLMLKISWQSKQSWLRATLGTYHCDNLIRISTSTSKSTLDTLRQLILWSKGSWLRIRHNDALLGSARLLRPPVIRRIHLRQHLPLFLRPRGHNRSPPGDRTPRRVRGIV